MDVHDLGRHLARLRLLWLVLGLLALAFVPFLMLSDPSNSMVYECRGNALELLRNPMPEEHWDYFDEGTQCNADARVLRSTSVVFGVVGLLLLGAAAQGERLARRRKADLVDP
jgi:hypothetical protein